MSNVFAFLGVAALVIMTPGPDTAVTIRGTLVGDRRAGVMTALGVVSGQACWTVAASAGVTAVLTASEPAFVAVKLVGAAYLIWLGLTALAAAMRGGSPQRDRPLPAAVRSTHYRQGLLSNLTNPKMAAFFTSLLPQFGTSFATMLSLGLAFCSLTLLWLAFYATMLDRITHVLRNTAMRRAFEAMTGAVLVALGLRLATEPRVALVIAAIAIITAKVLAKANSVNLE
jgi:threonine/homoserine/homoserine lactone efflux protein